MSLTPDQKREVMGMIAQSGSNRRGLVSSYQPAPPMVKVQIQPPPTDSPAVETGWIPYKSWATGLNGSGWSVVAPPQEGQQVMLICEEADGGNYTAWGGYYSDVDTAPQGAQPGEIMMQHQSGSHLYLKQDGTIALTAETVVVTGNMTLSGTITAADVIVAGNISSKTHQHISEEPGSPTSTPIAGT